MEHTRSTSRHLIPVLVAAGLLSAHPAAAQAPRPRPWGRVSFFTNVWRPQQGTQPVSAELVTSVTLMQTDGTDNGLEFGLDVRHARPTQPGRATRLNIYDGFVGARIAGGRLRLRGGHMWLPDLGTTGSVAGASVEFRQLKETSTIGRWRAGAFAGIEPETLGTGYVPGVRKVGGYLSLDGAGGRRHTAGYIRITNTGYTERSVVTFSNFVNARSRLFVYQAGEYDLAGAAGQATGRLTYFFTNARVMVSRLELQGLFNRGRSIDARRIVDDVVNGRTLPQGAVDGLLYESAGIRVTATLHRGVRAHAGFTRDRTNRDSRPARRVQVGGSAHDLAGTGIDLTISNSTMQRPESRYHALYVSAGRQFGRRLYWSVDYATSVSSIRFTRSDGITIELQPSSRQLGSSAVLNTGRHLSFVVNTVFTTRDGGTDARVMAGTTYRFR